MLDTLVNLLGDSAIRGYVLAALMQVPGLPPILQATHIICVAVMVATLGSIQLRTLNLALRQQHLSTLYQRLHPWFWRALGVAVVTGVPFVIARPPRYFYNPIFGIKMAALAATLLATGLLFNRLAVAARGQHAPGITAKFSALAGVLLLITIIFAGRWIAYVDYLFWAE